MKNLLTILILAPTVANANYNDLLFVHDELVRSVVHATFSGLGIDQCESPKVAVDKFLHIDVFCKNARITFPFELMENATEAATSSQINSEADEQLSLSVDYDGFASISKLGKPSEALKANSGVTLHESK